MSDAKRTKLDCKTFSYILLGVRAGSKAYRLYDPISQRIIISRDVKFKEDKCWSWDKKYEESIMCNLEWANCEEELDALDENEEGNVDENEKGIEYDHEANIEIEDENFSSNSLTEESSPCLNEGRTTRPPGWMRLLYR